MVALSIAACHADGIATGLSPAAAFLGLHVADGIILRAAGGPKWRRYRGRGKHLEGAEVQEPRGEAPRASGKKDTELSLAHPLFHTKKDATLAQKLGRLQPFIVVLPHDCMGQRAPCGPT